MSRNAFVAIALFVLAAYALGSHAAAPIAEEARRHAVRGRTAMELAKTPEDYAQAVAEFQKALEIAPRWAEAQHDLAVALEQAGRLAEAIAAYRRYLELAPEAADAARIRDVIVRLEYLLERRQAIQNLAGTWHAFGLRYELRVEGDRLLVLGPKKEPTMVDVVFQALGGLAPFEQFAKGAVTERLELTIAGQELRGWYVRDAFVEEKSGCTIPEERAEAKGRILDQGAKMIIEYSYRTYRAKYSEPFFGLKSCDGVEMRGNVTDQLHLERS